MAEVVWLASYPKSGNTWTRALLAGYVGEGAFDLNALGKGVQITGLRSLDDLLGVDPSLLLEHEILALRPAASRLLARDVAARDLPTFGKVHSANVETADGDRVYPAGAGRALYVVRNPLDVAASTAPFFGWTVDRAIEVLADEAHVLNRLRGRFLGVLPEPLRSWSGHVRSWLDAPGVPAHVVRYEDLLADTAGTFAAALRFCGVAPDPGRVRRSVEAARFERLRAREAAEGFRERPDFAAAPFFRRGTAGSWRDELTPAQARRVVADHRATMERLGYSDLVAEVDSLTG